MRLTVDLETNGLLNPSPNPNKQTVTKIHCIVAQDVDTGKVYSFRPHEIDEGIEFLSKADYIIGHNFIGYDYPVIKKFYPDFQFPKDKVIDTLVSARLIWSSIKETDFERARKGILPGQMIGRHSLESWGYRLKFEKGSFGKGTDWQEFSEEMLEYCIQDVAVTTRLFQTIEKKDYSQEALKLEHEVSWFTTQMERNGFYFNLEKAAELYSFLCGRRQKLLDELKGLFGNWFVSQGLFNPKVNNKGRGYVKDVPFTKLKLIEFNPQSRDQIADRLKSIYDWVPTEFTPGGKPKVDETVIGSLNYPPCELISEYLMVEKRISQLAEAQGAWMKLVTGGRIYGSINPNGAVTGRATHSRPNMSQVPNAYAPYGSECRSLFTVPDNWYLMGADASGLELRCLAHFMAKYDDGKYADEVLNGDIHTVNQKAAGLPERNMAKTFIYAFLYGAGDEKIGSIVGKGSGAGKALKNKFLKGVPALKHLKDAVQHKVKKTNTLIGLDGRTLDVRSPHSALNTLLQSAGALVCKKWLVILQEDIDAQGLTQGWDGDYAVCAWSHDEVQIACRTQEIAEGIGKLAEIDVTKAGEHFNFRCPLAGESQIGKSWKETH